MKIRSVTVNERKAQLELTVRGGAVYAMPYAKLSPRPTTQNRIERVFVDPELGNEAVTYVLRSGVEGSVHIDHALEYNRDPSTVADLMIHDLTVRAQAGIDASGLSMRELARCMRTSVPQLYRLLDPTNTTKSIAQLIALLHVVGCDVEFKVKPRRRAA